MKTVLVISSFVAASHVGANASAFCLRRLGLRTHVLPTTLLGRHPGWGPPGGGGVEAGLLHSMWGGIKAQNIPFDAVMTGYMASVDQVELALGIISDIKSHNPNAMVMVDPVMGDAGRLYICKETANAIASDLIALADIITPNLWELEYITGITPIALDNIENALSLLSADVLATSVTTGDMIGALLKSGNTLGFVKHKKFASVPHGGGDALAATFLAHLLLGHTPYEALAKSTAAIFDMMTMAAQNALGELPLVERQDSLINPTLLHVENPLI